MPSIPFPIQSISNISNTEDTTQRAALITELAKQLQTSNLSIAAGILDIASPTLLTELQLKANLSETQPISYPALLTELGQKLEPSHIAGYATSVKQTDIKNAIETLTPTNLLSCYGRYNAQGTATATFTVFTVPAGKMYKITNITMTVTENVTWQAEINNSSRGLIRTTTTNKVESLIGDIYLLGTDSLVMKEYGGTATLSYSISGVIYDVIVT